VGCSRPTLASRTAEMAQPMAQRRVMTQGLTFLFAVAGGAAVGNLYWAQPLLDFIAHDLHAPPRPRAGWSRRPRSATRRGSCSSCRSVTY
jgi:hypothetical protein